MAVDETIFTENGYTSRVVKCTITIVTVFSAAPPQPKHDAFGPEQVTVASSKGRRQFSVVLKIPNVSRVENLIKIFTGESSEVEPPQEQKQESGVAAASDADNQAEASSNQMATTETEQKENVRSFVYLYSNS